MSLKYNCRKISFKDLTIPVKIGIHQSEKNGPQKLTFDIDLYVPFEYSTSNDDNIDQLFDYDIIRSIIYNIVDKGHIMLIETLSDMIIRELLLLKEIFGISLTITKYFYEDCKVSIQTFKDKS